MHPPARGVRTSASPARTLSPAQAKEGRRMSGDERPENLSVEVLCRRCREQTARYRRGESYDDRFCFDLFRRAVAGRDDRCWPELQSIYHDQVLAWCRRAGSGSRTEPADLVALTWEKFWMYYT